MIFLKRYILVLIIALAAVFRLWGLGSNPPHLTSDEAALGYNAYSILKTARGEHGEFLPIVFESFGDWKPGLYVYLTVPFVAVLGLTESAVRLPGAVSGIIAVLLIYIVTNILFQRRNLSLLASFFLAISPWHMHFSRGAWESGVALTLVLAGIYFFLRAIKGQPSSLLFSVLFFGLTLWTYQGAKLSTAIVVGILALLYSKEILRFPRGVLLKGLVVGLIVIFPIALSLMHGKTGRLEVYSVFSYPRPEQYLQDILVQNDEQKGSLVYVLYHSEPLNFLRGIIGRWTNHYSARFLLFEGDWSNYRHSTPQSGVLLLLDGLLLIAGLISLARLGGSKSSMLIWLWLALSPLPAALSRDSIHAVRALYMVIPLTFLVALGAFSLWQDFSKHFLPRGLIFIFLLGYLVNLGYFIDQYWIHGPVRNSKHWQYGYKQVVEKVTSLQGNYPEIIVKQDYSQPYIFFLFYQRYDPAKYQQIAKTVYTPSMVGDVGLVTKLDNVTFRDLNWHMDRGATGKLFVLDTIKVPIEDSNDPREFKLIDQINFLNSETAFRLVEVL